MNISILSPEHPNHKLHNTCWGKNIDTLKYFVKLHLKNGADINWIHPPSKQTALDVAWQMHNHKLVEFLKSLGAKTAGEILLEKKKEAATEPA